MSRMDLLMPLPWLENSSAEKLVAELAKHLLLQLKFETDETRCWLVLAVEVAADIY